MGFQQNLETWLKNRQPVIITSMGKGTRIRLVRQYELVVNRANQEVSYEDQEGNRYRPRERKVDGSLELYMERV